MCVHTCTYILCEFRICICIYHVRTYMQKCTCTCMYICIIMCHVMLCVLFRELEVTVTSLQRTITQLKSEVGRYRYMYNYMCIYVHMYMYVHCTYVYIIYMYICTTYVLAPITCIYIYTYMYVLYLNTEEDANKLKNELSNDFRAQHSVYMYICTTYILAPITCIYIRIYVHVCLKPEHRRRCKQTQK